MMNKRDEKPNLFEYVDYRKYLTDMYVFLKDRTAYFSYRYFSKIAGFSSPNFYKLVAEGKRNLSDDGIARFSKALKHDVKEARYFRLLVHLGQAQTGEEKDFFTRQLFKSKSSKALQPLTEEQYNYYSEWYHIPLRELVERIDFKDDPKWIASLFTPHLTEKQAKDGLETLLRLGFIERAECGYRQTSRTITSGDGVMHQAFQNFQARMIQMGAEAMDRFPQEKREVSSMTLGVSHVTVDKIKKLIKEFQEDVIALASEVQTVEEVVQMNVQLFPLLKNKGEL